MSRTLQLIFRGSFLNVFSLVVSIAVALYMMPFLIHSLGDRWYGMWTLVGSVIGYYNVLDLGISAAAQRFISIAKAKNDSEEISAIILSALLLVSIASITAFLVSCGIAWAAPFFMENAFEIETFRTIVIILGINVAFNFIFWVFVGTISAQYRFDINSFIQIFQIFLRSGLIIYFVNKGYGIVALAIITLIANIASGICSILISYKLYGGFKFRINALTWRRATSILNFGFYAFLSRIAHIVRFGIDNLIIAGFMNLSAVTHYAIASRLAEYFNDLMTNALGILTPVFSEYHSQKNMEKIREKYLQAMRIGVLASTIMAGAILIYGGFFIGLWVGKDYLDSYGPLIILTVAFFFNAIHVPSYNLLFAIAKHKHLAFTNLSEAAINLILSLILVRYYGMIGVALASAIPLVITRLIVIPYYVCQQIDFSHRLFQWQTNKILILCALGQWPLWHLLTYISVDSFLTILVTASFYYAMYIPLTIILLLPKKDQLLLIQAIPFLKKHADNQQSVKNR